MELSDIPSNKKSEMSWIREAKELVARGFLLSVSSGGIGNQVITVRAIHEKFGSVHVQSWTKYDCPIRFNWLQRVV